MPSVRKVMHLRAWPTTTRSAVSSDDGYDSSVSGDAPNAEKTPEALFAGRYMLSGAVGQGAMGSVERAYDQVLRRNVAIKRLLPNMVSEARRARLMREARAAA